MYNTDMPTRAELPSSAQLIRSTVIAFITAAVLLVTVVMPADYGIDPTGIGRVLKLKQMGEIKKELAAEAAADAAAQPAAAAITPAPQGGAVPPAVAPAPVVANASLTAWRDETRVTLQPGEGIEIKLSMKEGAKAHFAWAVEGGVVNFDTHGDALGRSISYEKGRGVAADAGELVAAFNGKHGWFWRNRGQAPVALRLQTGGDYSKIER